MNEWMNHVTSYHIRQNFNPLLIYSALVSDFSLLSPIFATDLCSNHVRFPLSRQPNRFLLICGSLLQKKIKLQFIISHP